MGARAEMSGGRLSVRSIAGHGTIVEFWIPTSGSDELSSVTAETQFRRRLRVKHETRAIPVAVSVTRSDAFEAGRPIFE